MDYMEMMRQRETKRTALIEDGTEYTYGRLVEQATRLCHDESVFGGMVGEGENKKLHVIQRKKISEQLVEFLACSVRELVPLLLPMDVKAPVPETNVPVHACMAVATSGSSGTPKILYRTYESWTDFFPVQNEIFGIGADSRLFAQGSLAFTGNLNLYLAQFFAGGTVVAQNAFRPREWEKAMIRGRADAVYLIPSKLLCLPQVMTTENPLVHTVLSGSQSLGGEDARQIKKCFPNARILLYYGASELSYVTYVTDEQMGSRKNLIGKPFPGVGVSVHGGKIYVDTPYCAEGISCPCTLCDRGYMDQEGNLYFAGRSDDIVGIRGRKVSVSRVENAVDSLPEVCETVVILFQEEQRPFLTAFVRVRDAVRQDSGFAHGGAAEQGNDIFYPYKEQSRFLGELRGRRINGTLRERLEHYEMPCRLVVVSEMPLNDSGKVDKKILSAEWREYRASGRCRGEA